MTGNGRMPDIVQDTLVKAIDNLEQFKGREFIRLALFDSSKRRPPSPRSSEASGRGSGEDLLDGTTHHHDSHQLRVA
jgi:hypothetical protein